MKQKIIWALSLLFVAQSSYAIKLNEQIQQNVEAATKSYEQLVNQEPSRLWIHVQNEEQKELLENLLLWFKPISLIKIEPIQVVKKLPKKSQLRFFSREDKDGAGDLLKKLQNFFPQLELQDFSSEYGDMGWLKSGHYELWLSADVKKIAIPEEPAVVTPAPQP